MGGLNYGTEDSLHLGAALCSSHNGGDNTFYTHSAPSQPSLVPLTSTTTLIPSRSLSSRTSDTPSRALLSTSSAIRSTMSA